jgi:hypothetical protein
MKENGAKEIAGAVDRKGCAHRDKHLVAHMIPINLTTVKG